MPFPPDASGSPTVRLRIGCHSCHVTPRNDRRRRLFAVANAVQERVARLPGAIRHVSGPRNVRTEARDVVLLSIGRDAAPWIDELIEHHLSLGVKHVFFLDNRSTDDTIARASRHAHVSVFRTGLSFRRYEVGLRRAMVRRFGARRWSLYCDADELFDYPGSSRLPLAGLIGYLDSRGYQAMTGQMLDLVSERTFAELAAAPSASLKQTYRYYDLTDLVPTREVYWIRDGLAANDRIACLFGGIRKRFFGDDCLLLTKHPLVFADARVGVYTYDGHFMTRAKVADVSAVLMHYKYIGSLPDRVRRTVAEGWHNKVDALYGNLGDALGAGPQMSLRLPTSRELSSADALVDEGFLVDSPAYREWVAAHAR